MTRFRFITGNRTAELACLGAILLIPLLILVPGWEGFGYSPRSIYSDLVISHYPNAHFLLDTLSHGQFPLWSPLLFSGYPFVADPLAGLWYPPGWLAYLLPLPLGFHANTLLHLWWSGVGMLMFLRALGLANLPALAGALAWELLPKTFAHFGAGHLSLVYAIAWTPWLLLAEQQRGLHKFHWKPGLILGLLTLADVRWIAYAGGLWLLYSAVQFAPLFLAKQQRDRWSVSGAWGSHVIASVALAGLLAMPQLLPLAEYSRLSTRVLMTATDNLTLSLAPLQLFGLIAPNFQSYAEWTVYLGVLTVLAVLWSLTYRDLRRKTGFWLVVLAVAVTYSLGANFPPNQWLARLPGLDLLRVPSRFMWLAGFAGAVILARFLQTDLRNPAKGTVFWANLSTFGGLAFNWAIVLGLWVITGAPPLAYLWGAVGLTLGLGLVMLMRLGWLKSVAYLTAMVVLLVLDLGSVSQSNVIYRQAAQVVLERAPVVEALQTQPGVFRVYSPSYSIPQQTAAWFGLETVHGIDPLQLKSYVDFMRQATGISIWGYSVTIPPFDTPDELAQANRDASPNAGLLGLLNVGFVVADYPLRVAGLEEWQVVDGAYIYRNAAWRPRAWVQAADGIDQPWRAAELRELNPNHIQLQAEGPGKLVLAEIMYPGWQVWVDGIPGQWQPAYGLLRAVRLEDGVHQVEVRFQPVSAWLGLILGVLGWGWVGLAWWRNRERKLG